ncbi:MAG: T9SS type A sorting domain-containing protein [Ignavibacteria bacterium]|nr:T9SS type A sorting domain-containing protein [Ignavibacteria bacterium]
MKKHCTILALILFTFVLSIYSSPRVSFKDLLEQAETNPNLTVEARSLAVRQNLPVNIMTTTRVMIDAKMIEDGKVVYAVFTNFADIYSGGYAVYGEDIAGLYDFHSSRIDLGSGRVVDNTGGMYDPAISQRSAGERYLMVTDWTADKVYLFNAANGDLVDVDFIPTTAPQLQSPRHAVQHLNGKQIIVSDQLSDVVQRFDTSGVYLGILAPSTGLNNAILDNIRGIAFRQNTNLLVTVGSGASQNKIQEFDSGGVFIGSFISSNLNSPFFIFYRTTDMLISCSSGDDVVRFDHNGTFLSIFNTGTDISFAQQVYRVAGGRITVASFSTPNSGLTILDSNGLFVNRLTTITGNRGQWLLGNGHYLVTNGAGVHEIDSSTGVLIRTVTAGANFQFISFYNPEYLVSTGNNSSIVPDRYELFANYPNPFNPSTVIKYQVPQDGLVKITVFDASGKEIRALVNDSRTAGTYEVIFNGEGLSTGVYFCRMESGTYSQTMKMAMIK